ncbi:Cyclic nucleotide-binding protein [Pseudocohnilembus persalinus]|uniref:Cyclic nucleotide-binding protein n=1 Tax=Pseudocohnilembus persalinus TaxID=266149 RepID=A0A0V0R1G4_PSEPJ|nr:Cyclic nucleotide-binding protein [Pseudocohnilembus persalinus]|eukprot:KRX08375.1 Cyclic nucleotide-binding protein [Pseudocohnilembus persalinus]
MRDNNDSKQTQKGIFDQKQNQKKKNFSNMVNQPQVNDINEQKIEKLFNTQYSDQNSSQYFLKDLVDYQQSVIIQNDQIKQFKCENNDSSIDQTMKIEQLKNTKKNIMNQSKQQNLHKRQNSKHLNINKYNNNGILHSFNHTDDVNDRMESEKIFQKYTATYELTKLIFVICLVAHYSGLFFYYVTEETIQYSQDPNLITWLSINDLLDKDWVCKYIYSIYFTFITMSTVGYGDIYPVTLVEKITTIFLTLISSGVFGYALNTIGTIFRDRQLKQSELKQQKYEISKYLNKRHINKAFQIQAFKALEYMDQQQENGNIKGLQVLKSIPKSVSKDIFIDYYGRVLTQSKFFKDGKYSLGIVNEVAEKMKEITIGPGTQIYKQGEVNQKFYFLIEGTLQIQCAFYHNSQKQQQDQQQKLKTISYISGNQELDFRNFYNNLPSPFTISSKNVSRLVYIEYESFQEIISKNQNDYQNFRKVKDTILFNKTRLPEKCYVCKSWVHNSNQCPRVFLSLNNLQVIGRFVLNIKQERKQFNRNKLGRIKQNSYLIRKSIRKDGQKMRQNIVSQFYDGFEEIIHKDYNDLEFFYLMPKVQFLEEGRIECINDTDDEDQTYFMEEEDLNNSATLLRPENLVASNTAYKSSTCNQPYSPFKIQKIKQNIDEQDISPFDSKESQVSIQNIEYQSPDYNNKFCKKQSSEQYNNQQLNQINGSLQQYNSRFQVLGQRRKRYYEFNISIDKIKKFSNYFQNGNYDNIINKLHIRQKHKMKKYYPIFYQQEYNSAYQKSHILDSKYKIEFQQKNKLFINTVEVGFQKQNLLSFQQSVDNNYDGNNKFFPNQKKTENDKKKNCSLPLQYY